MAGIPDEILKRIQIVTNKRARFVLDKIVENGIVTTEEINHAGYDHPPRAARDVRELGFPLLTVKVKHSNGRSIAAYQFPPVIELVSERSGRRQLPKKLRDMLIEAAGHRCQICGSEYNLQVDHRIPYEIAGESLKKGNGQWQVLCGSCNRRKSWECEHCKNWRARKVRACRSCYWAAPDNYSHIAMREERRVDLTWSGGEISEFDQIRLQAKRESRSIAEQIKSKLKG